MITTEQILELAKTCRFDSFTPEDRVYWECWEEQLIEFALKIHEMGYNKGHTNGWLEGHESGSTGPFGEPVG